MLHSVSSHTCITLTNLIEDAEAVEKTDGFKKLQELYESNNHIHLWDFDGYPMKNLTFAQIINDPNRPMGHAFVLAMCLTGEKVWMK